MIKCSECKFFNMSFNGQPTNFIQVRLDDSEGFGAVHTGGVKICHHSSCFYSEERRSPELGNYSVKIRFQGQAQLNKNNDCPHFKKRFLWFW